MLRQDCAYPHRSLVGKEACENHNDADLFGNDNPRSVLMYFPSAIT